MRFSAKDSGLEMAAFTHKIPQYVQPAHEVQIQAAVRTTACVSAKILKVLIYSRVGAEITCIQLAEICMHMQMPAVRTTYAYVSKGTMDWR